MTSLKRTLKRLVERVAGSHVWLEPASDLGEVRSLLQQLKPVVTDRPLIRIGADGDGGYLAPDDLEGISVAVSPGVSVTVDFDLWMAERGAEIYMADASVNGPPEANPKFHFYKKFLDVFEDDNNMRLDTLCAEISPEHEGDRILQIDIEGAEYRVLMDASDEVLKSFRIILVEFHHLDRLFAKFPFLSIKAVFDKLQRHFHIVHIHPNNVSGPTCRNDLEIPPVMEFTFYRKDRATIVPGARAAIPHPLDSDNLPGLPAIDLPKCWQ